MKSCKKAVRRRNNSERPQNRHLRPWKKGDPNIPKSPGRPRTRWMWDEIGRYIMEHPDSLDDYFGHPVLRKKRLQRLFDAMLERNPALLCHCIWGKPR